MDLGQDQPAYQQQQNQFPMEVDPEGSNEATVNQEQEIPGSPMLEPGAAAHLLLSSSVTFMTSVTDYKFENGRRYHAFKEGSYVFPNDEEEMNREDMKHHIVTLISGGRLFLAPLHDDPKKILDVGTGTGIWPMQMADKYPNTEITATDISPIQPQWVPPNLRFEIDDAEAEWLYPPNSFDYIHVRFCFACIRDWPLLIKQAMRALKPGGYLEICELLLEPYSEDNTIPSPSQMGDFINLMTDGASRMGLDFSIAHKLPSFLAGAGFEEITPIRAAIPFGPWPKDKTLKEAGFFQRTQIREGLTGLALGMFTRVLGWNVDEVQIFLAGVRAEIDNGSIHSVWPLCTVYGRKPLPKEEG